MHLKKLVKFIKKAPEKVAIFLLQKPNNGTGYFRNFVQGAMLF